jgi:large repetitive protein
MRAALLSLFVVACSIPGKVFDNGGGSNNVPGDGGSEPDAADPLAPTVMLTSEPPALGKQSNVTFEFTVDPDSALVECRLDGGDYASCTPPSVMYPGTSDGMHGFDLRATNNGHTAAIPTYGFAIDTTPPNLAITSQPASVSPSAAVEIQFSIGDATAVTCQLDAQPAQPCTSPAAYSGLSDGAHTFTLTGADALGNSATKSCAWTVDTSAPSLAITSEPPLYAASATAQFGFTIGDSVTVTCSIDGGTPAACTSPFTKPGLGEGSHSFVLRGTDAASNVSTATYTWTVDTIAPTVTINTHPISPIGSGAATFMFTASEGSTACSLDSATFVACTSPQSYSLADGNHNFRVMATDNAGNVSGAATYSWLIDTKPPVISSLTYVCSLIDGSLTVNWAASDVGVGIQSGTCTYPNGMFPIDCTTIRTYSRNLQQSGGMGVWGWSYTDGLGHTSTASLTILNTHCASE